MRPPQENFASFADARMDNSMSLSLELLLEKGLKLLILDEDNNVCKETTKAVYREVFQEV